MHDDIVLRPASATDWPAMRQLLLAAGLPTDDLDGASLHEFIVAYLPGGQLAGTVGLERYGRVGLLRSLVVAEPGRGQGLGASLLRALESRARASGITDLWLLTIDAETFFSRHGYATMDRSSVPAVIAASAEFSALCPASAPLMYKPLAALAGTTAA